MTIADGIKNMHRNGAELTEDERRSAIAAWKAVTFGGQGEFIAAGLRRLRGEPEPEETSGVIFVDLETGEFQAFSEAARAQVEKIVKSIVHADDRLWDSLIVKEPKIEDARARGTETHEALRAYLSEPNGIVRRPTGNRAQRRKQLALARKGGAL